MDRLVVEPNFFIVGAPKSGTTNISLIGIGCIVLIAVLLMTAVIPFSIVTVVSEKK